MGVNSEKSACPYCGVGCGVVLSVKDGKITGISGDRSHPANGGRLCTKGKTAHQAISAPGRLEAPLVRSRRDEQRRPLAMPEAIAEAARRLNRIADRHGPDSVALYVSGQMSMEAQYLANKLAKGFLRTRHIESNSRLCMASAGTGYKLSLGADAPPGSYDDFDKADLFFVIGANMADCHPILFLRMMDRVNAGAKLVVVDPRRTGTAEKADLHLRPRPGTDLALLNGLLQMIVEAGATDQDFIDRFTTGWDEMLGFLADYTPQHVASITGIPVSELHQAARMIIEADAVMSLWTMGLNQSVQGTFNTNAICNLHLATGKISKPGSGPFSLTGQPNAMGGREMGYMGPGLPGQRSALVAEDRAFCEERWGLAAGTIRAEAGRGTIGLFEDIEKGEVRAIWVICTNPVASVAGRETVRRALDKADLVIVQDIFAETETTAYADIVLPAATSFEADGVVVNSERNMTLTRKAVAPPGEAMPDWQIIAAIACAMGYGDGFTYASAADVFDEIRGFANPLTGYDISAASHERLMEGPIQWPAASPSLERRNPLRYRTPEGGFRFATPDGRARFLPRPHVGPAEQPDDEFPFILNTGRLQHQWHTMTRTGKVDALRKLNAAPFVEIHPRDAVALNLQAGDKLEIRSRRGHAILPAVVTDRVVEKSLFAPFHWNDLFGEGLSVNAVTGHATDPYSLQPEFKVTAVRLARVPTAKPAVDGHALMAVKPELAGIAAALGVNMADPLPLDETGLGWLKGFLIGLRARKDGTVPAIPDDAPLSQPARLVVSGMLAGLYASAAKQAMPLDEDELCISFASQTGTAEALASELAEGLRAAGRQIKLLSLDDLSLEALSASRRLIVIASTFGDGDPPDNASGFWADLMGGNAPDLSALTYQVIALGDSTYGQFCGFGTKLDARLAALGGKCVKPVEKCDAGEEERAAAAAEHAASALSERGARTVSAVEKKAPRRARRQLIKTQLTLNRLLSKPGSAKEVRQFGFSCGGDLSYEAGDALGVVPRNCPALVAETISALGLDPEIAVPTPLGETTLTAALGRTYEIARPSPEFLSWWAERCGDAALRSMLGADDQTARDKWLWGRQVADIVSAFPAQVDAAEFVAHLKPLSHRLYSIASSPKAHPDMVHLTVSVLRHAHHGNPRKGVASTFMADRADTDAVEVFVQKQAHFRPPADPDRGAIMVGPGTGIAPFRAFLQDRQASDARGGNWLFFGEQNREGGFYYEDEMQAWLKSGHLNRIETAFSRDQAEKVYVQHRMLENGADVWAWLQDGAHFYVCGDAGRMARDVEQALLSIAATHGGLDGDRAKAWLLQLTKEKRYARDVY
ncbi:molybdopterin-dependent oxidoreductase [Martelella sp. HB161492]|uniref:molybdopterin-dependent oxidoreductase n=1 Tax=Martelella sp. HB161492 TaxID=2720726 RepID=UPI001591D3C5|nr:molybdopterin-dependent oxidoreductase [Martelella sp. HB161492]